MDDIALNKSAIIRRCLSRVHEEYQSDPARLENFTIQDSLILNLLRACEASIDLAMHQAAVGRLGIPQNSRDAFDLLAGNGIITPDCAEKMKRMVGFRNIAVHDYQRLRLEILRSILERNLVDFEAYLKLMKL
jgi:uncharacterized protein YutE (UPF0331/DUF86 family)